MTPILTRLAREIDGALGGAACMDAITTSKADLSLVHWRFLARVLRAMPPAADKEQATFDAVIAGMDTLGRGEEWTEAEAAKVAADAWAAWAASAMWTASEWRRTWAAAWAAGARVPAGAEWAWAAAVAAAAARASLAGVTRARQRDILIRLIEEANE